jgi:uncharacterized protein YkwD
MTRLIRMILPGMIAASCAVAMCQVFSQSGEAGAGDDRRGGIKIVSTSSSGEDAGAEKLLLELANQRRKEAGVPPLRFNEKLLLAARRHARLMADNQEISHQFEGEPSLMPRLRATGLETNAVAENVAMNMSAAQAFDSLMKSPPHRQNLLDSDYNAAGMAAIWSGNRLYVVQDFARVREE